jgi:hypothetical protein
VTVGTGSSSSLSVTGTAHYYGSVPALLGQAGLTLPTTVVGFAPTL